MMDHYSQFPAPPYEECKRQAITVARLKYKSWAWNPNDEELNALVTEAFMDSGVLEFNNDPNPKIKYSYSGWCVFGKNDVITSCDKLAERKRKQKIRRESQKLIAPKLQMSEEVVCLFCWATSGAMNNGVPTMD